MQVIQHLQKWGNGIGIRLPKKLIDTAGFEADQSFEINLKGRSVILTPVDTIEKPRLASLFKGVTPDMIDGELAWGSDVGAECYE